MSWKMTYCRDSKAPVVEKTFENFEDGRAWVEENAPILLHPDTWRHLGDENFRQFGTNYHWASFRRI